MPKYLSRTNKEIRICLQTQKYRMKMLVKDRKFGVKTPEMVHASSPVTVGWTRPGFMENCLQDGKPLQLTNLLIKEMSITF